MTGSKTPPRAGAAEKATKPRASARRATSEPGHAGKSGPGRSKREHVNREHVNHEHVDREPALEGAWAQRPSSPRATGVMPPAHTEPAPATAAARSAVAPTASEPATPGADRIDSAVRVLRRFRAVFNAVKSHFQQVEKQAGIGGAQLWALSLVEAQPGIGVGALARQMDVHQTTASNLVRSLVEQGLVASQRSGADRRATELRATRSAARVLARAPGPFAGVLPDALRQLDGHTLHRLDEDLQQLLQLLATDRKAERIPLAEL